MDWDAALVVDEPQFYDETLYLMELANVQLAELEAYDRMLDAAVERSYRDIVARRWRGWQTIGVQRDLREIRIDLARLSDELSNITKFFGDWHLARIYRGHVRPLPPGRLAPDDRRQAQDAGRPVPTAPVRAEQPVDADAGGVRSSSCS